MSSLPSNDGVLSCLLLNEHARLPVRSTPGSAGYDITSCVDVTIPARGRALVSTGLKIHLPSRYMYARVASRSGLALKNGVFCIGGVVDADYSGEIGVILVNSTEQNFEVKRGDRVAQLVVELIALPSIAAVNDQEYAELHSDNTQRGANGYGSSGLQ
jgi:dUTP pyrophosphatase